MDAVGVHPLGRLADLDAHLLADLAQLGLEVLPLAHAQVVEVLALAHPPERAARQLALLLAQVAPQVQPGEEVGGLVGEAGVLLVGLLPLLDRPLARILQREHCGDDEHVPQDAEPFGLEDHPAQPRVDGQAGQSLPDLGEPHPPVGRGRRAGACHETNGTELFQELDAVGDGALVRRLHEREPRDLAEPERRHLEDDRGQVGAQDLGVGEQRPGLEVLLGVQPDRDARLDAAAPAGPLLGARLADRLDGEALHLGACRVAGDTGDAAVDDVPDAGHGQRRLGDVGGEHDAAPRVRGEDPVLLGRREA